MLLLVGWVLLLGPELPAEIFIEPLGTKTIKGRGNVPPISLLLAYASAASFCFIRRLPAF